MAKLWSTTLENGIEIYVDFLSILSGNGPTSPNYGFIEWDVRSINTDWRRNFLDTDFEPIKQKSTADALMERGDQSFHNGDWRESLEYFNQALCYAIINQNNQFNTLFAKRALCFGKMKMYEKAIHDVDVALIAKLPAKVASELQNKKAEWEEELIASVDDQKNSVPALSFEADRGIPCMANVLEIQETADMRSYVIARSDIDVGQVVLVETAFVSIANGYDRASCFTCLKTLTNLAPCTHCTDAMFCNIECMAANEVHKIWCDETFNRMPNDVRLVVQSILQAIVLFPTIESLMEFVTNMLHNQSEENTHDVQRWPKRFDYGLFLSLLATPANDLPLVLIYKVYKTLMSMHSIQSKFDTEIKRRFLIHLVGHHAHVLSNNAFGGVFEDKDRMEFVVGTMFNVAALVEHSCTPNLMHFPIGNREIFITMRPVKAGEHLNFDYWLPWADQIKCENHTTVLQSNGIECECGNCERHTIQNEIIHNDQLFQSILELKKQLGSQNQATSILMEKCIEFVRKFQCESWTKEMEMVTKTLAQCFLAKFNVER